MAAQSKTAALQHAAPEVQNLRNAITIQNVELPVVEIEGQRVVTLSMVDKVHQRPEGTASRNFREHRPRFIETEDYFEVTADEIRRQANTLPELITLVNTCVHSNLLCCRATPVEQE